MISFCYYQADEKRRENGEVARTQEMRTEAIRDGCRDDDTPQEPGCLGCHSSSATGQLRGLGGAWGEETAGSKGSSQHVTQASPGGSYPFLKALYLLNQCPHLPEGELEQCLEQRTSIQVSTSHYHKLYYNNYSLLRCDGMGKDWD